MILFSNTKQLKLFHQEEQKLGFNSFGKKLKGRFIML